MHLDTCKGLYPACKCLYSSASSTSTRSVFSLRGSDGDGGTRKRSRAKKIPNGFAGDPAKKSAYCKLDATYAISSVFTEATENGAMMLDSPSPAIKVSPGRSPISLSSNEDRLNVNSQVCNTFIFNQILYEFCCVFA